MRAVKAGEWKHYRVTEKKVYSGELKDYLVEGMEFDYNGVKLRMDSLEVQAPNIRGMIRQGWMVEVEEDREVDEGDLTLSNPKDKARNLIERSMEAKAKSLRVMPEGWAGLHWTHKIKFIEGCGLDQKDTLQNIVRSERRSVKEAAEKKLRLLSEPPSQEPEVAQRGPAPFLDAEAAEELARAVGAEQAPQGEGTTVGEET